MAKDEWMNPPPDVRARLLNPYSGGEEPDYEDYVREAKFAIGQHREEMGYPVWRSYPAEVLERILRAAPEEERQEALRHKDEWAPTWEDLGIEVEELDQPMNLFFGQHEPTDEELEEAARYIDDDPLDDKYWVPGGG